MPTGEPVYHVDAVADRLGICEETVRRYLRRGVLVGIRRGNLWYIRESAIVAFLAIPDADVDVA